MLLETIWGHIVKSWLDVADFGKIPMDKKISYMPEDCQYLHSYIVNQGGRVLREDVEKKMLKSFTRYRWIEIAVILIDNGLVVEDGLYLKPYYMKDVLEEEIN